MFWIGFLSIYILMLVIIFLGKFCGWCFNKLDKYLKNIKAVGCAVGFIILSYIFTLLYSLISFVSGNQVINTFICTFFLVSSWGIVEKMYQFLAGESKENKREEEKILSKEDKNLCNLSALVAMVLSSTVRYYESGGVEYIGLICVAISVWIGAYIPISEIYKGTKLKEIFYIVFKEFKSEKKSIRITAFFSMLFIIILNSQNVLALKLSKIFSELNLGMTVGSMVMFLGLTLFELKKGRKNIKV